MIELCQPNVRALIERERGGRLISLNADGHEFIADQGRRPNAPDWYGGSFLLAPWAGKVEEGMHGLAYDQVWRLTSVDSTAARFRLQVNHPVWQGVLVQRYRLSTNSLTIEAQAIPISPQRTVLGMHPWFKRERNGESPETITSFAARVTPDGRIVAESRSLSNDVPRDQIYLDAQRMPVLRWQNGSELEIRSAAPVWVVYEQDELGVCIEPWTGTTVDFAEGRVIASPDKPATLSMTLTWSGQGHIN